jgi:hypothetical protein
MSASRGARRGRLQAARFPARALTQLDESKYLMIRAGQEHRFIWVWVVVVKGRVYIRSWNDKPAGWYRAFLEEPRGAIQIGEREIAVRAKRATTERIMAAVEAAYAEKYTTPASLRYVRGFKTARRRATTTELVPR